MARRTIQLTVHLNVDEDEVRDLEDADPVWWPEAISVLRTATHHIVLDNLPARIDPDVFVSSGRTGLDYMTDDYKQARGAVPGELPAEEAIRRTRGGD